MGYELKAIKASTEENRAERHSLSGSRGRLASTDGSTGAGKSESRASKSSVASPTPRFQLKQSWPQVILLALPAVGVVADAAGVIAAPPILQICLGIALILAALWVLVHGRRWTFISSPRATAIGAATTGVIISSLGVYHSITADKSAVDSANREVCAAAENYSEAYIAAATQWAATGLRTPETERADTVVAESLNQLSQSAIRSNNDDLKVLVHDIRMRANLGLAQGTVEPGDSAANLKGAWTSLTMLDSLCDEMGYPLVEYSRLPIAPSVERACQLIDDMVALTSASDADKWTSEQDEQLTALLNMFFDHGLNSADDRFAAKAADFLRPLTRTTASSSTGWDPFTEAALREATT